MADETHYVEAADGLEKAAEALRACAKEEAAEDDSDPTPRSKQPKNLRDAGRNARKRFAEGRGEKPRDDSDD